MQFYSPQREENKRRETDAPGRSKSRALTSLDASCPRAAKVASKSRNESGRAVVVPFVISTSGHGDDESRPRVRVRNCLLKCKEFPVKCGQRGNAPRQRQREYFQSTRDVSPPPSGSRGIQSAILALGREYRARESNANTAGRRFSPATRVAIRRAFERRGFASRDESLDTRYLNG